MSGHGPEEHCYWRERYLELQDNMAYSFEGFAHSLETERATGLNKDLQRELATTRAELAKLKGSKLGRAQQLVWKVSRRAKRAVKELRARR